MIEPMCIEIRDAVESDLPQIFRIVTDPQVRPLQFRLSRRDTLECWRAHLFGERKSGPATHRCTAIVRQGEFIGHVIHTHYQASRQRLCYCGWNLAPAYWGRGIAVIALSQLFDDFFQNQQVDAVISDCFSDNQRCLRVLQKLNYTPVRISVKERLRTMVVHRCLHWICRYYLSADQWHARTRVTGSA